MILLTHIEDDDLGTAGDRLQRAIATSLEADDNNDENNGLSRRAQAISLQVDEDREAYEDWLHAYVSPIHGNEGQTGYQFLERACLRTMMGMFHFIALKLGFFGDSSKQDSSFH